MLSIKRVALLLAGLVVVSFFLSCAEARWFTVSTRLEIPLYNQPVRPGDGFIWIEGEWFWNGSGYHWREGYWAHPHDGIRWDPGYWRKNPGGWYWKPGRWRR